MRSLVLSACLFMLAQPCLAATEPQAAPTAASEAPKPPKKISKELASGDGLTRETAYVIHAGDEVSGVAKEYAILRYLGLEPDSQSLVIDGDKSYDMLKATDPQTGQKREVWFDISRFFGGF